MVKNINTNQVGFMPNSRKTCVVRAQGIDSTFSILDSNRKVVYEGILTGPVEAKYAKENVLQGDFSDFISEGTYIIKVSNGEESNPFTIAEGIYDELLKETFLMLTRQRCGCEVSEDIAGKFAHPSCHDTKALIYGTNQYKDVNGGWHDAGDYGRYIVAGAETVADLLLAYELSPETWSSDSLGIPESGNGVPDILDEARYELDWMLKMQEESTGGVYHKVTCKTFPPMVMPQEETDELVLSPISIAATADFAAIMAKASSIYTKYDMDFSSRALEASKIAYDYVVNHSNDPTFKNPEDIRTGEYGDREVSDEILWAAVELYKVTKDDKYKQECEAILEAGITHGFGWSDMGSFANETYLSLEAQYQNPVLVEKIKEAIVKKADEYIANANEDGYMVALGDNYCWGSNLVVCSYAREMLMAADITGNPKYKQAAYDQLTYLLGQNATGYCFVSGFGTVSPKHPHHRPSAAVGEAMSGMVAGGPCGALLDAYMRSNMQGTPPAKAYADHTDSYSTNEITIYWNSPFVYLLTAIISGNK